jgi:hypothetical protein
MRFALAEIESEVLINVRMGEIALVYHVADDNFTHGSLAGV